MTDYLLNLGVVLLAGVALLWAISWVRYPGLILLLCSPLLVVGTLVFAMDLLIVPIVLAFLGFVAYHRQIRGIAFGAWSSVAFVAVTAYAAWPVAARLHHLDQLIVRYPFESVAEPLRYEARHNFDVALADQPPAAGIGRRAHRARPRSSKLEWLHAGRLHQFVAANGLGVARMSFLYHSTSELDAPPPAPVVLPVLHADDGDPYPNPPPEPSRERIELVHQRSAEQFLSPDWLGYVRSREQVSGFLGHRFATRPETVQEQDVEWAIARLELVSLLKFASPQVYLSETLPTMEALKETQTRPLDPFEHMALAALEQGETIVVEQSGEDLRMLGALRATEDCTVCHQVPAGHLLGAFSYRLAAQLRGSPHPPDEH